MGPSAAADDFAPVGNPTLEISRASGPIKIDGELDDPAWRGAARAANFAEHQPGDQVQPPVETEAFITYDDDYLYAAFICQDDPGSIRASYCDRDRIFSDDVVFLLLDTYGDATWAYELAVNPYGIQGDLLWSPTGGEDSKFDMVYESAGKITDRGYQVEMAVPFSSLRFPVRSQQTWKVDFWRNHPRSSRRQYSWAALNRGDPCWPCQWGTITGLGDVKPGRGIELLPSVISYQAGQLDSMKSFVNDDPDGELSLGAKYAIRSNITAEATFNPDFSQIESDVAQIDVNTTFALSYPERRPFFQEGSDLFNTWLPAVYTRQINDPQFAGKFAARLDGASIIFLTARDEHSPIILPFEEESVYLLAGKSVSNIVRARCDVGDETYIGVLITDRRLDDGGSGTLASLDGQFRLTQHLRLQWQLMGSHTEEPDDTSMTSGLNEMLFDNKAHTAGFDGESFYGHGAVGNIEGRWRHVDFDVAYRENSPVLRVDNGFFTNNNARSVEFSTGYTFFFDNAFIEQFYPNVRGTTVWNFDGVKKEEWVSVQCEAQLKGQTSIHPQYLRTAELFRGVQFDDIWNLHFCMHSNCSNRLAFNFGANYGHRIARDEVVMGKETRLNGGLTIKPIDRLLIERSFDYIKSDHLDSGEELFAGYIMRTRVDCQATRRLSTRLVVQYNDFSETWEVDPLLTYRISPFSVFYIGSTYDYNDIPEENYSGEKWRLSSRQYFMKLQYLFQL